MKKRIYFFIRTLWDLIPAIWEATKNTNFNVGVFYCNDKKEWEQYLLLQEKIAQIIKPNYKQPEVKKGKIGGRVAV